MSGVGRGVIVGSISCRWKGDGVGVATLNYFDGGMWVVPDYLSRCIFTDSGFVLMLLGEVIFPSEGRNTRQKKLLFYFVVCCLLSVVGERVISVPRNGTHDKKSFCFYSVVCCLLSVFCFLFFCAFVFYR